MNQKLKVALRRDQFEAITFAMMEFGNHQKQCAHCKDKFTDGTEFGFNLIKQAMNQTDWVKVNNIEFWTDWVKVNNIEFCEEHGENVKILPMIFFKKHNDEVN